MLNIQLAYKVHHVKNSYKWTASSWKKMGKKHK